MGIAIFWSPIPKGGPLPTRPMRAPASAPGIGAFGDGPTRARPGDARDVVLVRAQLDFAGPVEGDSLTLPDGPCGVGPARVGWNADARAARVEGGLCLAPCRGRHPRPAREIDARDLIRVQCAIPVRRAEREPQGAGAADVGQAAVERLAVAEDDQGAAVLDLAGLRGRDLVVREGDRRHVAPRDLLLGATDPDDESALFRSIRSPLTRSPDLSTSVTGAATAREAVTASR